MDISESAIAKAKVNARLNSVAADFVIGDVLDALVGGANDRVGRCIHRHAGIDPFESDRRSFAVIERLGYETRLALRTI